MQEHTGLEHPTHSDICTLIVNAVVSKLHIRDTDADLLSVARVHTVEEPSLIFGGNKNMVSTELCSSHIVVINVQFVLRGLKYSPCRPRVK